MFSTFGADGACGLAAVAGSRLETMPEFRSRPKRAYWLLTDVLSGRSSKLMTVDCAFALAGRAASPSHTSKAHNHLRRETGFMAPPASKVIRAGKKSHANARRQVPWPEIRPQNRPSEQEFHGELDDAGVARRRDGAEVRRAQHGGRRAKRRRV